MPAMNSTALLPTAPDAHVAPPRVRSCTDLRRFTADDHAGMRNRDTGPADAYLGRRRVLFQTPATEVGAIELPAGRGRVEALAADEFIVVCDGALVLEHVAGTIELAEGESAVLISGGTYAWRTTRPTRLAYMRHADRGGPAVPRVIPIDVLAALQPSAPPAAELLTSPTPSCRSHVDHRSADGEFTCGTWDSTAYSRKAMRYAHSELMVLLEGAVTLEDETGASRRFERGDIFVVQQGALCAWDSREPVRKVYAIVRPA